METPPCGGCGSRDFMKVEDSGPTFTAWRCHNCDRRTEKKNGLGKSLPFVGPVIAVALAIIGIEIELDGGDA